MDFSRGFRDDYVRTLREETMRKKIHTKRKKMFDDNFLPVGALGSKLTTTEHASRLRAF